MRELDNHPGSIKGVYATYITGAKDVVAFDKDINEIKCRVIQVLQASTNGYISETGKPAIMMGAVIVKIDGKSYECMDFQIFNNKEQRDQWLSQKKPKPGVSTS